MSTPTSEGPVAQDLLGSSDEQPKQPTTYLADNEWAYVNVNRMGDLEKLPIERIFRPSYIQHTIPKLTVNSDFENLWIPPLLPTHQNGTPSFQVIPRSHGRKVSVAHRWNM